MQQRQPRVGDIVEDYCPRERRLSDHAVVAMVGDIIRQSRCTACDTEHEYRDGKVPVTRKKTVAPLAPRPPAAAVPATMARPAVEIESEPVATPAAPVRVEAPAGSPAAEPPMPGAHEGPVHRRLIRAVLPRVEGEVPTRQAPEFTMHTANQRPASNGRGFRQGGGFGGQQRQGNGVSNGPSRSHGGRAAGHGGGHAAGQPGARGGRPGAGHGGRAGHGGHGGQGGQAGHGGHGLPGAGRQHGRSQHDSGHASRRKH